MTGRSSSRCEANHRQRVRAGRERACGQVLEMRGSDTTRSALMTAQTDYGWVSKGGMA